MEIEGDLAACADLVRRGDPDRFLAAMAAPVAVRRVLFPLYAFNVEVARAPWVTAEPMIAEMRLQWWRDALEEIAAGTTPRRHEVTTPLAGILDSEAARVLQELVEARRADIYKEPFADVAALQTYIERTSVDLMWVAARALGSEARDVVLRAGYAQGMCNFLRAIPALEQAGWHPLPECDNKALRLFALDGLERLRAARVQRGVIDPRARGALLPVWKTGTLLARVARAPDRVRAGAMDISPLRSRLILMSRAATGRW